MDKLNFACITNPPFLYLLELPFLAWRPTAFHDVNENFFPPAGKQCSVRYSISDLSIDAI